MTISKSKIQNTPQIKFQT